MSGRPMDGSPGALLLTPTDAADRLGVSPKHLRRLSADGRIPAVQVGRHRRYRPADIDAFLEASRVPPGSMSWAWQKKDPQTGRWRW